MIIIHNFYTALFSGLHRLSEPIIHRTLMDNRLFDVSMLSFCMCTHTGDLAGL